jgi:oligopeptide transport system ATP-binding protein
MRQRIMVAMALICGPAILFADEPTTALDVTIQAQIIQLMNGLKKQLNASIVLITHDLGVVANMAQRIYVMYAGKIVERGDARSVFYNPRHPYTWGLLYSVPRLDAQGKSDLSFIPGTPPDLLNPPVGCAFAARCPYAMNVCARELPPDYDFEEPGHSAACWLYRADARVKYADVIERRGRHG